MIGRYYVKRTDPSSLRLVLHYHLNRVTYADNVSLSCCSDETLGWWGRALTPAERDARDADLTQIRTRVIAYFELLGDDGVKALFAIEAGKATSPEKLDEASIAALYRDPEKMSAWDKKCDFRWTR